MNLEDSGHLGEETVYGTHEDSHVVMSEKVQSLAGSIYQEFERMIARYDEDVVKTLMPLLVNVLECLDAAYQTNQEHDVELELLREDNEQLVTQYEREKGARKSSEQKLLEFEDASEGERKELTARLEALESIARMLELKHKNSMEHASRLEEREAELKKEYAKLHDRYTELFKTHVDYMERTKLLLSGGQLANECSESSRISSHRLSVGHNSGPISFGFASLEVAEGVDSLPTSPISSSHSSPSLHSELDNANNRRKVYTAEKAQETDSINLENKGVVTSPVSPQEPTQTNNNLSGRVHTKKEQRSGNTLYQELSFQDAEALADMDDGADITGSWVHPGEYASSVNDNFYGMGKEVENLIMENNELLATKNALNVVKDDLIAKVDELTGDLEMSRDEILSLKLSNAKLEKRCYEFEEEMKKNRENNETSKPEATDEEADVPLAQRKRFTRVEMARVLMERNQYKERFMELQEAVRWTEMIRASRNDIAFGRNNKQGIWKFFSNLFTTERTSRPIVAPNLRYQACTHHVAPDLHQALRRANYFLETEVGQTSESFASRRAVERVEQYRRVRAHVRKENGRLQAYGWSLPGKLTSVTKGANNSSGVPVPVPIYCQPLAETSNGMKVWCAAGVNLMGGYTKDGGLMVGGSVFYSDEQPIPKATITEVDSLEKEINDEHEASLLETKLSSLVWICTSTYAASIVTVIDANNPAEILNSFGVCANHIFCIASIPGASLDDYNDTTDKPININEDNFYNEVSATNSSNETENPSANKEDASNNTKTKHNLNNTEEIVGKVTFVEHNSSVFNKRDRLNKACSEENVYKDRETDTNTSPVSDNSEEAKECSDKNKEQRKSSVVATMSSVLATMWLGAQNGMIYVHSSVANWNQCIHSVKLDDAVVSIVHVNGRVVTALANGTVAVFRRSGNGEWDLSTYHIVKLGPPFQSVRNLVIVGDKVWCSYKNMLYVLDPKLLKVVHKLEAHPRKESQVRQCAWLGEGVWVSIRLDSTLRLYHAKTYQHLQDVDIEPYVSKMLGTGKLGFSYVRISTLLLSSHRLWIGTSNGVIISIPLSESACNSGIIVSRRANLFGDSLRIASVRRSFIPFCSMAHAQLSFHGHREAVRFFVAVPGNGGMSAASTPSEAHSAAVTPTGCPPKPPSVMLVMSGGDGYIDFRVGDGEMEDSTIENENGDLETISTNSKGEKSHLIVWQVSQG